MKKKAVLILCLVLVAVGIGAYRYVERSYYPMGGVVSVVSKEAGRTYSITIEQGTPEEAGFDHFKLQCTKEQYDSVSVGDVIKCERSQSVVTHRGTVHRIR